MNYEGKLTYLKSPLGTRANLATTETGGSGQDGLLILCRTAGISSISVHSRRRLPRIHGIWSIRRQRLPGMPAQVDCRHAAEDAGTDLPLGILRPTRRASLQCEWPWPVAGENLKLVLYSGRAWSIDTVHSLFY